MNTHLSSKAIGNMVKERRKELRMTQRDLALASGTGVRFISDLENGKRSCELGKALDVLNNLGLELAIVRKIEA